MSNLNYRQSKIQEKRKQTSFRDFVMEIASRRPVNFYKTKGLISRYPDTARIGSLVSPKNYERNQLGDTIPYSGSFFSSFQTLRLTHQGFSVYNVAGCENCEYGDMIHSGRDVYLSVISVYNCENILYSFVTRENCKNIYNSLMVFDTSENIYQSSGVISSYNIFYSKYITNSSNIWFSTNCVGCSECINCSYLTNQSFCIDNVKCSKDEYIQRKQDILRQKHTFGSIYSSLPSQGSCESSANTTGSFVVNANNIENGYYSYNINNSRNVFFLGGHGGNENMYDMFVGGAITGNHCYACQGAGNSEQIYCSAIINDSSFLYYCIGCIGTSFCFGCIGLENKSYCILNKQYTKEERYIKVDEIFSQMDADGTLGNFFPASMNPFYFNDTAAYLIDPSFTKEEVTAKGYLRRDEAIKVDIPEGMEIVKTSELGNYEGRSSPLDKEGVGGDLQRTINANILKKVIQDEQGNVYRIIPMEYKFLVKHGLPLPRKHWLERMKENFRIH